MVPIASDIPRRKRPGSIPADPGEHASCDVVSLLAQFVLLPLHLGYIAAVGGGLRRKRSRAVSYGDRGALT